MSILNFELTCFLILILIFLINNIRKEGKIRWLWEIGLLFFHQRLY